MNTKTKLKGRISNIKRYEYDKGTIQVIMTNGEIQLRWDEFGASGYHVSYLKDKASDDQIIKRFAGSAYGDEDEIEEFVLLAIKELRQ